MKMKLLPWNKAQKVAKQHCESYVLNNRICGLDKDDLPWGKEVEIKESDQNSYYEVLWYYVPKFLFKKPELVTTNDALHYGTILTDDELFDHYYPMDKCVRIRIIAYNGIIYYHKIINGETVEFKKVGVEG